MTTLTAAGIGRVAYAAGFRGTSLVTAIAVALGESSGRVEVVNSIGCVGLWQINQPVHVKAHPKWTRVWLQNARNNADAAWVLSNGGRNWGPWTVYTNGTYKRFLPQARKGADSAVRSASSSAGGGATGGSGGGGGGRGSGGGGGDLSWEDQKDKDKPDPPVKPPKVEDDPDPRARLGKLWMLGSKLRAEIAEAVTDATVSWSTAEVTQLTLTIADPGLEWFRTGLFEKGTAMLYREPRDGTYPGLDLELRVASVTVDGGPQGTGGMTVMARSKGVALLKARTGSLVMKKASPTEFVEAECKKVGLKCVAQKTAQRTQIKRDVAQKGQEEARGAEKPSSWTTFQRLAAEVGFYCYEYAGTVYFGKPSWLIDRDKEPLQVALPLKGAPEVWVSRTFPTISTSVDADVPVLLSNIEIERTRLREVKPGAAMRLRGLPPFDDKYLVTSMTMPLLGTGPISLSAETPKNPPPQPPAPPPSRAAAYDDSNSSGINVPSFDDLAGGATGAKSAAAFVAVALRQAGDAYVWAAHPSSTIANPEAFDCSGLVAWAAGRVGVPFAGNSASQIARCRPISVADAIRTRGALLYHPGHIAISLGNGRTIEAANPGVGVVSYNAAGRFTRGGLIPGMRY